MELSLTAQTDNQIAVTCDDRPSHSFDLSSVVPDPAIPERPPHPLADPVGYGQAIYQALFPSGSPANQALAAKPTRLLLVTDTTTDAAPWEYAYGPDGFLVLDVALVRGLPADKRIAPPALEAGLHIVAVPSNPLDPSVAPLNIDGEWQRLTEVIQGVAGGLTLERTRPATLEHLRRLVAGQRQRVIHFMGHGGVGDQGALLFFEQLDGSLAPVTARDFMRRIKGTTFLVTLNACVSAMPGPTTFANLAAALTGQGTPYALGMRFSVSDADARTFSRVFYSELARGVPVEDALQQARLELADSPQAWAVGVPVLYTALSAPAPGFAPTVGQPTVREHQTPLDLLALPRAEGVFQGRQAELRQLGARLTGDSRPRLLTLHGTGGQGKTALAREAVERFAHASPGGALALALENLPAREQVVASLARFLRIETETIADPDEIERQVLQRLGQQRTLLVLDNAETLVQAAQANDAAAQRLAQLLREQIPDTTSLLVTSREYLGWGGEEPLGLDGLDAPDGARLFLQAAALRAGDVYLAEAQTLSTKVAGHPLSLRLLGSAFSASSATLAEFVRDYDTYLLESEDRYRDVEHRHRSLYQNIDFSVRFLDHQLRGLLGGLAIFHAPFLPEIAAQIFDPDQEDGEDQRSAVFDQLHQLAQRSLLETETTTTREGTIRFYRLHPTVRLFAAQYLASPIAEEVLLQRFGAVYAGLIRTIHRELNRSAALVWVAQVCADDFDRGLDAMADTDHGWYALRWGWVLQRLGNRQRGLALTEQAHAAAGDHDQDLLLHALNNMASVYHATGQPQRALALYEQALPILRAVGDRAGEAATLTNMASVYAATGQPQQALALYEQALPLRRAVGDRAGEAATLTNMASVYHATGQPQRALALYEQALPLRRAVGDRAGEAATLNNMALVYAATGQPQRALALYEQALPLRRAVGDRAGEATTLNNMALVYAATGQPQRALALYEQALPLRRAVGDRAGEATTLNNMALVYHATGQPQRALALYEEALPLRRAVGDRAGEAATLNNMALVYHATGQPQRALALYEQALPLMRAVGDRAGEAATLANLAVLLYQSLQRIPEAVDSLQQAIAVLERTGLDRDSSGTTIATLRSALATMQCGEPLGGGPSGPATLPAEQIRLVVANTVAVLTDVPEKHGEWRAAIAERLQHAQQQGPDWQIEVELYTTVLAMLDGQAADLPADHPYAEVIAAIERGGAIADNR